VSLSGILEPGSPWENWYLESLEGKFRDELPNGEIFDTLLEAQVLVERWRKHYNAERPHSSLGNLTPETFADRAVFTATAPSAKEETWVCG
jgi:transposase InsO family protein